MQFNKLFLSPSKKCVLVCLLAVSAGVSAQNQERGGRDGGKQERPQFSSLDLDGDGAVTFAEFEQSKVPNNEHSKIFEHIDADGNELITEEEFSSHKPPRKKR